MATPKFLWRIRKQHLEDGKIYDQSGQHALLVGQDVAEVTPFGAVLNRRSMQSGLTLPSAVRSFGTKPLTVSIWFNTTSNSSNSTLFGNRSCGSHGDFLCIRYARHHIGAEFDMNDGELYAPLACSLDVGDGKWHQVTVVRKGCDHRMYVDGELQDTKKTIAPIDLDSNERDDYRLGVCPVSPSYDLFFEGIIGDVAIYDCALDEQQVEELATFPTVRAKSARS